MVTREPAQMGPMALSVLTGQVAAQPLHRGLDRGVVNLCELFYHGHHQHTPCNRAQAPVSSVVTQNTMPGDLWGREGTRVSLKMPTCPNGELVFALCLLPAMTPGA